MQKKNCPNKIIFGINKILKVTKKKDDNDSNIL